MSRSTLQQLSSIRNLPSLADPYRDYLAAILPGLDDLPANRVAHDWGSALGFHRATRYPAQIRAIAYMEAIAMPMRWEDFGEAAEIFRALRSEVGETMIMEQNAFVETILPQGILRKLTGKEMDSYRARILSDLAEPDRNQSQGGALPPGRLSAGDRDRAARFRKISFVTHCLAKLIPQRLPCTQKSYHRVSHTKERE